MAMGMTPSSEIAQRFANALMQAFCRRLDEAEAKANFIISEAEAAWRSTRSGLAHDQYGTQARLFDANMYTDDPARCVWSVCGAPCLPFVFGMRWSAGPVSWPQKCPNGKSALGACG